jgi:putative ATPase
MEAVENHRAEPVPMQLRNAPTGLMKQWGYSAGYQHAHNFDDALTEMECLPESLAGMEFYHPTDRGMEQRIAERLRSIRARKKKESPSE